MIKQNKILHSHLHYSNNTVISSSFSCSTQMQCICSACHMQSVQLVGWSDD